MGESVPAAKRGAKGPAPARRMTLHDAKAVRVGMGLVISLAATGEVLAATKPEVAFAGRTLPAEDAHALYDAVRTERFWRWAEEVEAPRLAALGFSGKRIRREIGRTYVKRFVGGEWELEVQRVLCPAR